MSLRFIYGRAGSGKSSFCLQDIKSKIDQNADSSLVLLVPEDFSFQAEKNLVGAVGERGLIKARVLSFKRMAYMVFGDVGGLTRRHMNGAGKCMLIYRIMDKCRGDLKVFSKTVKLQGFVNSMSDIITELKIYDINPQSIEGILDKLEGNDILKTKLEDINLIYSMFEDALHEKYIDSEDDLTILSRKMDDCHIFDGGEVWVDGFSMFTPQQYKVLEKLLKKAKRVNITLCTDSQGSSASHDRADVFSSIRKVEERIFKIARDSNISLDEPVKLNRQIPWKFKDNPEIAHLEKNLYAFPYDIYEKKTENISIFKALNRYTEVENTARDIVSLCRDKGYRFSDIAVVTNDMEDYEKLVSAIFSEYNIPFFLDKKRDISGNPLIVLILSAMEIYSKNWSYESVFRYLKTNLVGIDMEDIDMIENYVLAAGIKGKRWTEERGFEFWPDYDYEKDKDRLSRINDIRGRITEPLVKFHSSLKDSRKAADTCSAIFNFLCSIGVPGRIEKIIEEFKYEGELALASEYSKVWNILIEALDQIVEVLGDEEMSIDEFIKILYIGFGEYSIGLIPPAIDQVTFGSVERIKSHNVKALYILGVNDGIFPSNGGDEGIFSDSDRENLQHLGIELAPTTKDKVFDEQYLVYTTFMRTEKYIRISYPIADHEGKALRASIIISRLKKIFKNMSEYSNLMSRDTDDDNLNLVSMPVPTFNELVHVLRRSADGISVNPLWKDVYDWYMDQDVWSKRCEKALGGIYYRNQVQPINASSAGELYGKQLRFSISRLEKYASCPFAYFLQYGLKAKERKIYEFSPPDMGSFIHEALDGFSKYLDENNMSWRDLKKDECRDIISNIVDRTVENESGSILSSSARYRYLKERLKRTILRAVWLIAIHIKRGSFEPKYHEVSFENGGKYPPISIELPSGEKLSLIGRIDRVDTMETEDAVYVRIIDYKSGNKDFSLSDIYNGLEFQLLIYLDAILEYASRNSKKPVIPGGILYFRVDDPIIKWGGELTDEEVEKEIMKKLKMRGLLISDVNVVREMDREIDGHSIIIPAMIKGDGTFGPWSSIASEKDFEALRKYVRNTIVNICEDMLSGNISISPYKKKKGTSCQYCSYKAICRFDVTIKENSYRIIDDMKSDEVWDAVRQESL